MEQLQEARIRIRQSRLVGDAIVLRALMQDYGASPSERAMASNRAAELVRTIRSDSNPGLMEVMLAEYGLSTDEGIALMCLAEALLRVPDAETIDALIEDKIAPSAWGQHLGNSSSSLVNASTWALLLTGKVLQDGKGVAATLKNAIKRLGEPIIRVAVGRAMKELGAQFVLGETIEDAVRRGRGSEAKGYTYSYDMLGEAALTAKDALAYQQAYAHAIQSLAAECKSTDIRENPGISIKLSALHPRYEAAQRDRVMSELVPTTLDLARLAKAAGMGLNIDAEEADRLELSLDVIEAVLSDASLQGWDGFGVVVQAYGKRAGPVIDWLYALSAKLDRRIMVRLVKGAYWDTEIKRAQVEGIDGFPVFTSKPATDVSYLCCARKLLGMTDRVYPQFATHNAHSVASILGMGADRSSFEFQRLHGMGERLHDIVHEGDQSRCRIYAPVGAHRDLLAYLVRRLLENGANSSFVNQIVDENVAAEAIATDPFEAYQNRNRTPLVVHPHDLYGSERRNARGWDLRDSIDIAAIARARSGFRSRQWQASPLIVGEAQDGETVEIINPAEPEDKVGMVIRASEQDVETALASARVWGAGPQARAEVLSRAADLFEASFGEFFAVLAREAGKTQADAVSELREAVDFLRYYAARGLELEWPARGVFGCISPWNFPLAIFTGQIAAALAAGNAVIAKPAEQTTLTGYIAVRLLHEAGVPVEALQFLPGRGSAVGQVITSDHRVSGVCFTGSTDTAQIINRAMAENLAPDATLIAETGGLNAMIVDSTALPEQAVKDIVASAFQSAGQRCSALRVLYLQEDVADTLLEMLFGAMDELSVGSPWDLSADVGPVIDDAARSEISEYVDAARKEGRVLKELRPPADGNFVAPAVIRVNGIRDLEREVFGPVLHIATFPADGIDDVVSAVNARGFGLTFGAHSRIDDRVEHLASKLNVGNVYINRNQIGAIVGSQPFGGEGLSGTGPKAGGPAYVRRFTEHPKVELETVAGTPVELSAMQAAIDAAARPVRRALTSRQLPGPTGESNVLSQYGRGIVLCLGPTDEAARAQAGVAQAHGCTAVTLAQGATGEGATDGVLPAGALGTLTGFDAVVSWAPDAELRRFRVELAGREGPLIPLITEEDFGERCVLERHVCVDTTAAGGNAALLAESS